MDHLENARVIKNHRELFYIFSSLFVGLGGFGYICLRLFFDDELVSNLFLLLLFIIIILGYICYRKLIDTGYAVWLLRSHFLHCFGFIITVAPFFIIGCSDVLRVSQFLSACTYICCGIIFLIMFLKGKLPKKFWKANMTTKQLKTKKRFDLHNGLLRVHSKSKSVKIWSGKWNYLSPACLIPGIFLGRALAEGFGVQTCSLMFCGFFINYIFCKLLAVFVLYPHHMLVKWEKEQGDHILFVDK